MRTTLASFVLIGLTVVGIGYYSAKPVKEPTPPPITAPVTVSVPPPVVAPAPQPAAPQKAKKPLPTTKIKRGNLSRTITASGIIKPEEMVEVMSQVTGMVKAFGSDSVNPNKPIDYGSKVRKDSLLAQIDPTIYQAQVDQTQASLSIAKANMEQLKARLEQAEREWKRAKSLLPEKAISDTDYDNIVTNYQAAVANKLIGQASILQNEASLRIAKTNLDNTLIKSPIDGVIIDRRVNIGQTVVAAVSAPFLPGLFLIAKDLQHMQVWASVDEEKISFIHPGMPVRFTLETSSDEVFEGKVDQIRLNATRTPDSASYTVVVAANNSHDMLPYMTAKLQFEIQRCTNALLIPNNALQWQPQSPQPVPVVHLTAMIDSANQSDGAKSPSPPKLLDAPQAGKNGKERKTNCCVLIKEGEFVRPIEVQIGITDGTFTEITSNNVQEGMEVVIGEVRAKDGV